MIKHDEIGLKVAENPEEKFITETIENIEKSIMAKKLQLELDENALKFLKVKVSNK